MRKLRNKIGITVVELLISSFISVVVLSAALGVYLTQNKHLIVQDQVSDMQHNLRAGMDEVASKIRMAGYDAPLGIDCIYAYNTNPDTIEVIYDTDMIHNVWIDHEMPTPSSELRFQGDVSRLNDGDWAFIYDPFTHSGEFFLITEVQIGSSHIQHNTMPLSKCYPIGSLIMRMNKIKYFIDYTTDPDHPKLMIEYFGENPQIYADNITDLQFQYVLSSGEIADVPAMSTMVREVKIGMAARTEKSDEVGNFGYRTRDLETTVKVRNLGIN